MKFDWQEVVKTVAPVIGTALGGPMGGMAVRAVASALLGDENAKEADIAIAVASASSDKLLELRKADQAFAIRMEELGIDLEKINQDDRASARQREVALHDKTPGILAAFVTLGFFGVLGFLLWKGVPKEGGEALLIMLGALGAAWGSVMNYYFGSSSGSKAKTDALSAIAKK